jgi:hypothetical protein
MLGAVQQPQIQTASGSSLSWSSQHVLARRLTGGSVPWHAAGLLVPPCLVMQAMPSMVAVCTACCLRRLKQACQINETWVPALVHGQAAAVPRSGTPAHTLVASSCSHAPFPGIGRLPVARPACRQHVCVPVHSACVAWLLMNARLVYGRPQQLCCRAAALTMPRPQCP